MNISILLLEGGELLNVFQGNAKVGVNFIDPRVISRALLTVQLFLRENWKILGAMSLGLMSSSQGEYLFLSPTVTLVATVKMS